MALLPVYKLYQAFVQENKVRVFWANNLVAGEPVKVINLILEL